MSDGPTVVFDIDGVLADASTRQHYINEPTAAALYYTLSLKLNGTFLVYDMGDQS